MDFAEQMEQERQRINKVLETIAEKRLQLDQEERVATVELAGIQAYLDAKLGKLTMPSTSLKVKAPKGTRGPRQTGIKERVLEAVTATPISKQDILNKMGAGEDKTMQQAISNALVALKKDGKVHSAERGTYMLPPAETPKDMTPKRVKKEDAQAPQT